MHIHDGKHWKFWNWWRIIQHDATCNVMDALVIYTLKYIKTMMKCTICCTEIYMYIYIIKYKYIGLPNKHIHHKIPVISHRYKIYLSSLINIPLVVSDKTRPSVFCVSVACRVLDAMLLTQTANNIDSFDFVELPEILTLEVQLDFSKSHRPPYWMMPLGQWKLKKSIAVKETLKKHMCFVFLWKASFILMA